MYLKPSLHYFYPGKPNSKGTDTFKWQKFQTYLHNFSYKQLFLRTCAWLSTWQSHSHFRRVLWGQYCGLRDPKDSKTYSGPHSSKWQDWYWSLRLFCLRSRCPFTCSLSRIKLECLLVKGGHGLTSISSLTLVYCHGKPTFWHLYMNRLMVWLNLYLEWKSTH